MKNKLILIVMVLFSSGFLHAQMEVRGVITGPDNFGLPGASVVVLGTTNGVMTDIDGNYEITIDIGETLVISYVGMITKEIEVVGDEVVINVQLLEDVNSLEEVVVVGYGTSRRKDLTSAVVSIEPEKLSNAKIGTATSALQGLAPGVFVTTGSVKPGGDASVLIRGQGSLNAGNAPLFIVDGMPVEGGLQDISPSDIESIEVLKDALSASIYGSRGSNGVIIVTTKSGTMGQGRVTFNASAGVQSMLNKQDLMNAQQYFELASLAVPDYRWSSEELRLLSRGESTDWQDAITQDGDYQNYNLSVAGGNEKTSHYLGVDWYDHKGTIRNSSFNKASVRYNMDSQTTDWLKSGIRFNVIESNLKNINEEADSGYGTMFSAISSQPTAPIYTEDSEYFDGFLNTKANPVAVVELLDRTTKKSRIVGSAYLEIEPIDNLVIRSENGGELVFFNRNSYEDGRMGQHYDADGHATKFNSKSRYLQTENTATYSLAFDQHEIKVMGGFSASKSVYENTTADSKNLSPILKYHSLGSAQEHGPNFSYGSGSTLASFFGRINYNFGEKYLATFSMRGDGSSKFAPGKRWGYFPALGVAWRLSEERFMENANFVNDLKLRVSAGMLGNQNIGDYAYASLLSQGGEWADYVFGGELATGSVQDGISNPELTWEKSQQLDVGLDFSLLNNRLSGTADVYYKITTDLLWSVPLPTESGFANSLTNVGQIDNKGFEFSINSVNISTENFSWSSNFNFTYNENEVVELYDGKQDVNKSLFVGHPIAEFYLLKSQGIWQQSEASEAAVYNALPGDRKILDKNDDGVINGDDRDFAGLAVPQFYGSFSNTINYKNFDFTLFFTYAGGHLIDNSLNRYLHAYNTWGNMSTDYYNNYWTPERPSNVYPAPRVGSPYANGSGTDAHLQKGDYIRLRNIELGYNLPERLSRHIGSTSIRLYVSAQNLVTFTEFSGFDVESGDNTNPYPNSRSFIGGISFNF